MVKLTLISALLILFYFTSSIHGASVIKVDSRYIGSNESGSNESGSKSNEKNNQKFCRKNPCKNGGTCIPTATGRTCSCAIGFTGSDCETSFCLTKPCQNGGTCNPTATGRTCSCAVGFTGSDCETSFCLTKPCQNGGTCNPTATGRTCTCAVGFTGTNCGISLELLAILSQRVQQFGALSGPIQITLIWNNINDLDLKVDDPFGERVFWNNKKSASGGILDVDSNGDYNDDFVSTNTPLENIVWTSTYPSGTYKVFVDFYEYRDVDYSTSFTLIINVNQAYTVIQDVLVPTDGEKLIYTFTV